jgi:diacylglycerol kinase (ATP)
VRADLASAFEPTGGDVRVRETSKEDAEPEAMRRIVGEAIGAGARIVVAAGGDGTVSLVADALAHRGDRVPLGIVPLGTANILARELRVPVVVKDAILLLLSGHRVRAIDAMKLGDRHYFTQIGAGPDALMIEETSREAQEKLGRLAYMLALLRRAFGHRSQPFTFVLDGRRTRMRAWQVVLANARTLGAPPFTWGPHVDPGDGVIDVCVYDVHARRDILRALWTLFSFRHRQDPNARYLPARKTIEVASSRPLAVQADGESIGETPIRVVVVANAVEVLTPAAAPGVEPGIAPRRAHLWRLAIRQRWDRRVAALWQVDAAAFLWINRLPRASWLDVTMSWVSATMPHGEAWLACLGITMLGDFDTGAR